MTETLKHLRFERNTVAKCLRTLNHFGGKLYRETITNILKALDEAIDVIESKEALHDGIMHQEVIKALEELVADRKVYIDKEDPQCQFKQEVRNLEYAIKLIQEKDISDIEAVHWMIVVQRATELLKHVQAFCPYTERKEIDEFLKKVIRREIRNE